MWSILTNHTAAGRLYRLTVFIIALICINFAWSLRTMNTTKVHGLYYQTLVRDKDAIADILPPPKYIVESYLVAHQLAAAAETGDTADFQQLYNKLHTLQDEYMARHSVWKRELVEPDLRRLMLDSSYLPVADFFAVVHERLVPACQAKDFRTTSKLLSVDLRTAFETHKQAINELVVKLRKKNTAIEAEVSSALSSQTLVMWLLFLGTMFMVLFSVLQTVRQTLRPLIETSNSVSYQAKELSNTAVSISGAVQQLEGSIRQISSNASDAVSVAHNATTSVDETGKILTHLGCSTRAIGEVVHVIQQITHQTNLLALNATIEAARAGDAGRGFAVVAKEVKELAHQTSEAAASIVRHIDAIQADSAAAITAVELVNEVMLAIEVSQTAIAGAVEEQTAMTADLGRSVAHIAASSSEIAQTGLDLGGQTIARTGFARDQRPGQKVRSPSSTALLATPG